jgi:hypothetical protein
VQTLLTAAITTSTAVAGNLQQVVLTMHLRGKGHIAAPMMRSIGGITTTLREVIITSKLPAIKATCSLVVNPNIVVVDSRSSVVLRHTAVATVADTAEALVAAAVSVAEEDIATAVVVAVIALAVAVVTAAAVEGINLKTISYSNI